MTLADFTSPGMIVPHLAGRDRSSVLQELAQTLQREGRVPELLPFYHAVLNREYLVSTDMEGGIAFPHARLSGVKEVAFAFGRTDEPMAWGSKGSRTVRLVFLLAVPATDSTQYLLLLSGLARLTKEEGLLKKIYAAQDTFQMLNILQQVTLRAGATLTDGSNARRA